MAVHIRYEAASKQRKRSLDGGRRSYPSHLAPTPHTRGRLLDSFASCTTIVRGLGGTWKRPLSCSTADCAAAALKKLTNAQRSPVLAEGSIRCISWMWPKGWKICCTAVVVAPPGKLPTNSLMGCSDGPSGFGCTVG